MCEQLSKDVLQLGAQVLRMRSFVIPSKMNISVAAHEQMEHQLTE